MNPLHNVLGNNPIQSYIGQINQLRSNPIHFLLQRRINVPQNLSNDPQAIIQHLLNTGQMSQDTYNKLQSQATQLMRR